jgi:hypothetical protein
MEIKTQTTKNDYIDFLKFYYFKRNLPGRIIPLFFLILLVSYNITYKEQYHFWFNFLSVLIVLGLLVFLFSFLLPYLISIWRVFKRFKTDNTAVIKTFSLVDEGIHITEKNEAKFCHWKDIKIIGKNDNFIFLRLYNKNYIISENSFRSTIEEKGFFNKIQTQIQNSKSHNVNRLYSRGWLGLIPLIGFFVGVWLIIEGAFKYKDRKLILIGIASVMFTVIFYSSLIYYSQYSVQGRKNFASFSQSYLNSLIKDIEFYKSQKGYYPDSLEELESTDKMVMIYDPILNGRGSPNNGKFYYKKLGNRYTLFSCGVDEIPNTVDDIFPSMDNLDTSKIGFIKGLNLKSP